MPDDLARRLAARFLDDELDTLPDYADQGWLAHTAQTLHPDGLPDRVLDEAQRQVRALIGEVRAGLQAIHQTNTPEEARRG